VAARIQVPLDLVGALILGALSTACARKYLVGVGRDPYDEPLFEEPLGLYIACGLGSGARKGPTYREVMAPIYNLQRCLISLPSRLADVNDRLLQKLADAASQEEIARAAESYDSFLKWRSRLTFLPSTIHTADVTPESLVRDIAENGERLAILSPEGGGVAELFLGKYSQGRATLETWCQAYSEEELRGSRIGRKFDGVGRPALTIVLAVQPDVIRDMAANKRLRDRGLFARFMCVLPKDNVGSRLSEGDPIPPNLRGRWWATMVAALLLPNFEKPQILELSGEAFDIWNAFRKEIEPKMAPQGEFDTCREEASKVQGRVARFAGLLHIADQYCKTLDEIEYELVEDPFVALTASDAALAGQLARIMEVEPAMVPIAPETVEAAVALGRYSLSHSKKALAGAFNTPTDDAARKIWAWITRRGADAFTMKELCKDFHVKARDQGTLKGALSLLVLQGRLAPVDNPRNGETGRRPSPKWEVDTNLL
jgi:hypothetical protein